MIRFELSKPGQCEYVVNYIINHTKELIVLCTDLDSIIAISEYYNRIIDIIEKFFAISQRQCYGVQISAFDSVYVYIIADNILKPDWDSAIRFSDHEAPNYGSQIIADIILQKDGTIKVPYKQKRTYNICEISEFNCYSKLHDRFCIKNTYCRYKKQIKIGENSHEKSNLQKR